MRVLVVGATGVLGRATVPLLRAAGHDVRAMTHRTDTTPALVALGAEGVQGDLIDPASLARACTGVDVVVAAAHGMLGRGRYRKSVV